MNAVAEQTINQSQKRVSGIIAQTRQVEYVTKWDMAHHEILAISNKVRSLTDSNLGSRETELAYEFDQNFCKSINNDVSHVGTYFTQKGKPHIVLKSKFYNIASKEIK